jgi:hypothetical protein
VKKLSKTLRVEPFTTVSKKLRSFGRENEQILS